MKLNTGYQKIIKKLVMLPLLLSLSGCVYLVVGGIGALGGYIVSPDTIEGITSNDELTVWDAAEEVMGLMGVIEESSENAGMIIADVQGAKITVSVLRFSDLRFPLMVSRCPSSDTEMSLLSAPGKSTRMMYCLRSSLTSIFGVVARCWTL